MSYINLVQSIFCTVFLTQIITRLGDPTALTSALRDAFTKAATDPSAWVFTWNGRTSIKAVPVWFRQIFWTIASVWTCYWCLAVWVSFITCFAFGVPLVQVPLVIVTSWYILHKVINV